MDNLQNQLACHTFLLNMSDRKAIVLNVEIPRVVHESMLPTYMKLSYD